MTHSASARSSSLTSTSFLILSFQQFPSTGNPSLTAITRLLQERNGPLAVPRWGGACGNKSWHVHDLSQIVPPPKSPGGQAFLSSSLLRLAFFSMRRWGGLLIRGILLESLLQLSKRLLVQPWTFQMVRAHESVLTTLPEELLPSYLQVTSPQTHSFSVRVAKSQLLEMVRLASFVVI